MNEPTQMPDTELTPICDPPQRDSSPDAPIGTSWWIEPSHPEVDPDSPLLDEQT